jgi:cytochrome-b5 reductase
MRRLSVPLAVSCVAGASLFFYSSSKFVVARNETALDPKNFKKFELVEIYPVSHNTKRYRFALEDEDQKLGLNVASCLVVKAPIGENGKDVIRPYTPVSDTEDRGFFDLIIKAYPQGVMSKHFSTLSPGDSLEFKGPFPKIEYKPNDKKHIGMIAGGTGITPMLQVIEKALKDPNDHTKISLIYANLSENDILMKQELDTLAARHRDRFKVYYTIDKATTQWWKHDVGFVNEKMINKYLPPPADDNSIFVCGPPPMMNHISGDKAPDFTQGELKGLLKKLGYTEKQVFKF